MRSILLLPVCFLFPLMLTAGKIDYSLLKKINGTSWELQAVKKPGFFSLYGHHPPKEKITFSGDRLLFDLSDANYYCSFRLQNKKEMVLYCQQPDEYIYRIRVLNAAELVFDVLVKEKNGHYHKWKRKAYTRA